ncbi:MAG: glycoside hydrolase family 9 protein, partial [Boseongicola sp.]
MVDQFGYRPFDPKVAVIVNPRVGYNETDTFTPAKTYQVRAANDHEVVFEASLRIVDEGKVQELSGDVGYWFDFSALNKSGTYYLFDSKNNARSHVFEIREDIYANVLKAAVRMFFYNRSGADKLPPYADPKWQDTAAFIHPSQDGDARAVGDKSNPATTRDLRGGWFDAGDTNKYVNNAGTTVHQLLAAYRERPAIWTDDFNIPESNNGLPDLIDEIRWEIDWLQRMQEPDGGVIIKVGAIDFKKVSPLSWNKRPRYYAPVCSSST